MKGLHLLYVHSTAIGYARAGVKLAAALRANGYIVEDRLDPDFPDPYHLACWVTTPSHAQGWFSDQQAVMLTMWESMALPEPFREGMDNFQQIIVPCQANKELFDRYHDNVAVVPLGVDPTEWFYRPRPDPSYQFRFMIAGSGSRKGQDVAFKAFRKVFSTWPKGGPIPVLRYKSPRPTDFVGDRIEHILGRISDKEEQDLYGEAHCYLGPSKGEGFGLQPLQAIAQGCPTILTNAHGQAEYAHLGYGIGATPAKADYFIYGDAGDWWEPNLNELCERMEFVYNNYETACEFAKESATIVARDWTWDTVAKNFVTAVGEEHFTAPPSTGVWKKPEIRRYPIRVNKEWAAYIAQTYFQFIPPHPPGETCKQPGQYGCPDHTYWEIADVKRILFETDRLDPSCIPDPRSQGDLTEEETGLTLKQLTRFKKYSAAHAYCWECGQMLNSGEQYSPDKPWYDPIN